MQNKINTTLNAKQTGLEIDANKTTSMRVGNTNNKKDGSTAGVSHRIPKAWLALGKNT